MWALGGQKCGGWGAKGPHKSKNTTKEQKPHRWPGETALEAPKEKGTTSMGTTSQATRHDHRQGAPAETTHGGPRGGLEEPAAVQIRVGLTIWPSIGGCWEGGRRWGRTSKCGKNRRQIHEKNSMSRPCLPASSYTHPRLDDGELLREGRRRREQSGAPRRARVHTGHTGGEQQQGRGRLGAGSRGARRGRAEQSGGGR
ncbi:unnamed protein product [Calypogeia fissa]